MNRLSRTLSIGAIAGVMALTGGVATASQGPAADPTPAPAARSQPTGMVKALADSLRVSVAQAQRTLDHQSSQQETLERLGTSGIPTGSAFFDAKGTLTVNVATARQAAEVKAAGLAARIPARTPAALDRIKSALDKLAEKKVPAGVESWHVDPVSDKVVVTVRDTADATSRAFVTAARSHGPAVTVRTTENDASQPAAAIAPGSKMNINTSDVNGPYCSVGFGARDWQGRQYLATAGHCIEGLPTLYFNGSRFAKGTSGRYALGYDSVDMGVAAIDSGNSITTAVGGWRVVADTPVRGSQRAAVGATVCKSGATTKWTCGTIKSYNNSVTYTAKGQPATLVKGLGGSTVCIHKGDSGGAWITGQGQGQGVTSGSGNLTCDGSFGSGVGWFQPLDDLLDYYGLTLNTAP
ncbi:S1 family peptidase [Streptomyces sp. NPDC006551]|uniref:S1 family peptidase n=1 Tax=Streptomyces sp. NPDC006551 TaxID=3157178 RepID=UPI0033B6E871